MNLIQRLESLSLALLALGAYWVMGANWWLFAICPCTGSIVLCLS